MMLNDLWEWWIEGLAAPWPSRVQRWLRGQRTRVWAGDAGDDLELLARRGKSWGTLWRGPDLGALPARIHRRLRTADIVLRLPADGVLKRTIAVPPGTSPSDHVGRHLDELSPFPGDQTCFDALPEPGGSSALLVIARKPDIEDRLRRLRECGLDARAVTVEDLERTALDLMPRAHAAPARPDLTGAALLTAGLLACGAAVAVPLVERSRALEALTVQAARLERRLEAANDTREQLQALRARAASIAGQTASGPDAAALLAEVTAAVPDHSWVRQWVLHEGTLTLHGESRDTADLIARLEGAPLLSNVRYDTATTRDADSGTDRFKLIAEVDRGGS